MRNIGTDGIQQLAEKGSCLQMNPLQFAAHFESTEALPVLLRHLLILWRKQKTGNQAVIENIIHSKATLQKKNRKSSLMFDVMTNKNFVKSENLLAEFEDEIHEGKSEDIKRCVYQYMSSSKESEEAVEKIMKIRRTKLAWPGDWWPIVKIFIKILIILLFKLTPISLDVTTDSILLVEYYNDDESKQFQNQCSNSTSSVKIETPSSGTTFLKK